MSASRNRFTGAQGRKLIPKTVLVGTLIGSNAQPWVYIDGSAVLQNVSLSAEPSLQANSACGRRVTADTYPRRTSEAMSIPSGLLLGPTTRVIVNASSVLACSVRSTTGTTDNYLIYTSSTRFQPYSASESLIALSGRGLLQAEVCMSDKLCKPQGERASVSAAPSLTSCHAGVAPGWPRVFEDGQFCLQDVCDRVWPECSAKHEGEWKCTDGGVKRSFDLQTRRFCRKIEAEEKTSLQKVL